MGRPKSPPKCAPACSMSGCERTSGWSPASSRASRPVPQPISEGAPSRLVPPGNDRPERARTQPGPCRPWSAPRTARPPEYSRHPARPAPGSSAFFLFTRNVPPWAHSSQRQATEIQIAVVKQPDPFGLGALPQTGHERLKRPGLKRAGIAEAVPVVRGCLLTGGVYCGV